ncbi:hypothetical protein T492DRAFT_913016, partial [Pavlovales sp. CCMP2436]
MLTLIRYRDRRRPALGQPSYSTSWRPKSHHIPGRSLLSFATTPSLGRALRAHIRCTCAMADDAESAEGADGSVLRTHTGPQRRGEALACVATVDYGHAAPERNAANE